VGNPFASTYLPDGFGHRLRPGAGLFKRADYPTEGLLGHYRGPVEVVHVNFQIRSGPLPYTPPRWRPLEALGEPGGIASIEGGYSVKFSLGGCDFRMDTYGISRAETVAVAGGLRPRDARLSLRVTARGRTSRHISRISSASSSSVRACTDRS
jgi:hypothetical protein